MTTKEIFLSLDMRHAYSIPANKIDFTALDSFVKMFMVAYRNRRSAATIREELATGTLTRTTTFFTRMIEVGTVQFLSENDLILADEEKTNELATVVAHGINISIASVLQTNGLGPVGGKFFFAKSALYGLIERVINYINNSREQEDYIFSLVSFNLMNFVNGSVIQ